MREALLAIVISVVVSVVKVTSLSYELEVPGKEPIRIIEADPVWDHEGLTRGAFHRSSDLEHRTLRPLNKISDRHDTSIDDYEDNSANLKKFLNSFSNEEAVKDEFYLKDKLPSLETSNVRKPENSKSWNLLHFDRLPQNHQQQDKNKGWVSMEAVPWSVSKISKWHERPKKDKYPPPSAYLENDRYTGTGYQDEYDLPSRPSFTTKPNRPRPGGYYDEIEDDVDDDPDDYNSNRRPSFPRPSAVYGHKVNVQTFGSHKKHKHEPPCKHEGEIITDGMPANFPEHEYGNRRRGAASETVSVSHPYKQEGEWVLLSTTKGYKRPKNRQRSIQFADNVPNAVDSIDTRKSVKLTVLPPLKNGKVNMTTSHGGLLQVESTFESVDDAQKAFARKQRIKVRRQRQPAKYTTNALSGTTNQQLQVQFGPTQDSLASSTDPASVLAAVGAGMIPASMALLLPMAMGRQGGRIRRDLHDHNMRLT